MLSKVMAFLLISFQVFAGNIECQPGEIKSYKVTKLVLKKDMVCFINTQGKSYLVSKKCKSKCLALKKRLFDVNNVDINPAKGNPSYQICKKINGFPEIVTVKVNSKVIKTDRCIFKDGSFVANDYLYSL